MFIKLIELRNFSDIPYTFLDFNCKSPVYIIEGSRGSPLENALSRAMQLICSAKYAAPCALEENKFMNRGFVRIVFSLMLELGSGDGPDAEILDNSYEHELVNLQLSDEDDDQPCTSTQALERIKRRKQRERQLKAHKWNRTSHTLDVWRDFMINPEVVMYRLNDLDVVTTSLTAFHARFNLNIDYILPRLNGMAVDPKFETTKWLDMLTTENPSCAASGATHHINKLFQVFANSYASKSRSNAKTKRLEKITTAVSATYYCLTAAQKITLLQTFRNVREIFDYLTDNEFKAYFFIPKRGDLTDIEHCHLDELDFSNMRTVIGSNTKTARKYTLNCEKSGFLQDLLFVAFKLALAYHCKQRIIYLNNLNWLSKYESDRLMCLVFRRNGQTSDWLEKNYLQRIIDTVLNLGLMAVIEYPEKLLLPIRKANIINCRICENTGMWSTSIQKEDGFDVKAFIRVIKKRFFGN